MKRRTVARLVAATCAGVSLTMGVVNAFSGQAIWAFFLGVGGAANLAVAFRRGGK